MALSLYDISVPSYVQTLGALSGVLDKGKAHAEATGLDLQALLDTRLIEDMAPLRFQIISATHHSLGAINGIKAGVFNPPPQYPDLDYDGLNGLVTSARDTLQEMTSAEVNALTGRDMRFEAGDFKIPFSAEDFILSFSMPNFFFHATTAYDLLRMRGVSLGKLDFMGAMRVKT